MDQPLIDALKKRAHALHQARKKNEPEAKRRECLSAVARELGFRGWQHATAVLRGEETDDFGTLLYPPGASAHWNIWSASYDEARSIREDHGGYLLAYRHQYLVVDEHFLETLGVGPGDPDWDRMSRDWVRPADPAARTRLAARIAGARFARLGPAAQDTQA